MRKYLDKSCSQSEKSELIALIRKIDRPDEMDEVFQEVWTELDPSEAGTDLSWQDVLEVSGVQKETRTRRIYHNAWKWSAAAAVVFGIYFLTGRIFVDQDKFLVFETDYGETKELTMEDGTKVSLNANSRLTWNADWENKGIRHVDLEGEAFFDVSHLEVEEGKMPFEVETSDLTINVLGTAFNAVMRRGRTEVFLERGLVSLSLKGDEIIAIEDRVDDEEVEEKVKTSSTDRDVTEQAVSMRPGELVRYSSEENELTQITVSDSEEQVNWRKGALIYHDVEFRLLLENLEDIYGKSFENVDEKLLSTRIEFGVPYEDWQTVKEMMEWMLRVEITNLEDNRVTIQKRKEK